MLLLLHIFPFPLPAPSGLGFLSARSRSSPRILLCLLLQQEILKQIFSGFICSLTLQFNLTFSVEKLFLFWNIALKCSCETFLSLLFLCRGFCFFCSTRERPFPNLPGNPADKFLRPKARRICWSSSLFLVKQQSCRMGQLSPCYQQPTQEPS